MQNSKFPWFPRFGALKMAQPWVCFPEATGRICSLGAPGQFLGGKRIIQGLRCDWSPPYKLSDLGDPATSSFTFLKISTYTHSFSLPVVQVKSHVSPDGPFAWERARRPEIDFQQLGLHSSRELTQSRLIRVTVHLYKWRIWGTVGHAC